MGKIYFAIVAILVAIMDTVVAVNALSRKKHSDTSLGITMIFAAVTSITYLLSVITTDYFRAAAYSSLYFSSISIMLVCLLNYTLGYTNSKKYIQKYKFFAYAVNIVCFIDVIIELSNPFTNIAITYKFRPFSMAMWQYQPGILYDFHLIFCYCLVSAVFFLLIFRGIKTPHVYRKKYFSVLAGILLIILVNAVFLILQTDNMLDYSILLYSLIGFYTFWNKYYYSRHGMLSGVRQMILNELEQPVFLFDCDRELVLYNIPAQTFIKSHFSQEDISIEDFSWKWNFPQDIVNVDSDIHFQWNPDIESIHSIYRVDVKCLKEKHRNIGKLIVMTNISLEHDILTGFHTKNTFETYFSEPDVKIQFPAALTICDINKLSHINKVMGKESGDLAIQKLASIMKKIFPENTYFARLEDANLLAVCPGKDAETMRDYIKNLEERLLHVHEFSQNLEIQSAISVATEEKPDIIAASKTALFSMRSKKLMDGSSSHSSLIDSLAQTLLESDNTTRAHVERTRKMGELLGKRLGFSDIQLSNLALLCLLHDIGKLGIPLEILNKPGKLSNAEWDVMKSHVEKGYRIAKSAKELESIADLILHHHESWNGKGYPDGLKQEAIPLLSRVIAIVDTYDAITNDRPYHKAESDRAARDELRRCAGVQFDPTIVSEFLNLLEELQPLKDEPKEKQQEIPDAEPIPQGVSEIFSTNQDTNNINPIEFSKFILNEAGQIISIDTSFTELTGYTQDDLEIYHLTQADLIPPEDLENYLIYLRKQLNTNGYAYMEHALVRKDGSIKNVICNGKNIFDPVTREPRTEVMIFDVSITNAFSQMKQVERESAQRSADKWESLLKKDSLTGLLNHESFINDVEQELESPEQKIVMIVLDIDYFKSYNDNFGHVAGDKLLSILAVILENSVKDYGFAGRLGGDEFAAILKFPSDTTQDQIQQVIELIFTNIMNTISSQEKSCSISLGAAVHTGQENFNKLYQAADRAHSRAKDNGRKCYSF